MNDVLAVILAGGRGERMNVLSKVRPKPVLPFAGNFRVVDFVLTNCMRSEIKNVLVLTDYQRAYMGSYIWSWYNSNGNPANVKILEPKDGSFTGTANAVFQHIDYLEKSNARTVLVLAADHIYKMDYRKFLAFHDRSAADATVGMVTVPIQEASRFGVITTDQLGLIQSFSEKPKVPKSNLVSMGIYAFNKDVLVESIKRDARDPLSEHDFGHAIVPDMVSSRKVYGYRYNDYWQDIGTVDAYYNANIELTRYVPTLTLNSNWPVMTIEDYVSYSKVMSGNNIEHSIISKGCSIRGRVENCVLSPGVRVEDGALVKNSIIMGDTVIGSNSVVDQAILDEKVNVGEFCYVGFGAPSNIYGKNLTVIGKDTLIPSHTAIGKNCIIPPGTKLANSRISVIQPDTVLQHTA
jgi:glucose-1-phosphate adenylyltransferase